MRNIQVQGAKLILLGRNRHLDGQYLDKWRHIPLTYTSGQPVDDRFREDHYEILLFPAASSFSFHHAVNHLLRYHFYPPSVMSHVSDFSVQDRHMQPGDRIIQRIRQPFPFGLTIIEGLTMNEISDVIDEPRRAGFTYVTTAAHEEIGEWSARLEWRSDDTLMLIVHAISRTSERIPSWTMPVVRYMQKRAHHLGIAYFQTLVSQSSSTSS